jgi:hypothetical protein
LYGARGTLPLVYTGGSGPPAPHRRQNKRSAGPRCRLPVRWAVTDPSSPSSIAACKGRHSTGQQCEAGEFHGAGSHR